MDRPHEDLIRTCEPGLNLRTAADAGMPTMVGRFASPGEWTEINSIVEGHFMERMAPSAFEKTIQESKARMRVLFHHGLDPRLGMQVLGPIARLDPDTSYEVPLFDTPEVRSLVPGLEAGQYGASFKFSVVKEDTDIKPQRSDWNPRGIPQVTITEAKVREFGPTPLPAYPGASAGLRSVTDEFLLVSLHSNPERLRLLVESLRAAALLEPTEPEPDGATTRSPVEPPHSTAEATSEGEEARPSWLLE